MDAGRVTARGGRNAAAVTVRKPSPYGCPSGASAAALIAHLDEYVIPAWMKGRAVVLADKPYAQGGENATTFPLGRRGRHAALHNVVRLLLGPAVALRFEKRLLDDQAPPHVAAAGARRPRSPRTRRNDRSRRRGGDEDGGSGAAARFGAGAPAASGAGAAVRSAVWRTGGGQLPSCAIKLSKACGRSSPQTRRAASPSVRRGDACRTPWRKCPSLTIALRAARLFSDRYDLPTLFLATDDKNVVKRDARATWEQKVAWQRSLNRTSYRRRLTEERWIERDWRGKTVIGPDPRNADRRRGGVALSRLRGRRRRARRRVGGHDFQPIRPPFYATVPGRLAAALWGAAILCDGGGAFPGRGPWRAVFFPAHTKAGRAVPLEPRQGARVLP